MQNIPSAFIGRQAARVLDDAVQQANVSAGTGDMLGSNCGGISMSQTPGGQIVTQDSFRTTAYSFYVVAVKAGPNGEANYSDSRYWARGVYFKQNVYAVQTDSVEVWIDGGGFWGTIDNAAENARGTHTLIEFVATGTTDVQVTGAATIFQVTQTDGLKPSGGDDDTGGNYLFCAGVTPPPLKMRITSVSGSFPVFTYHASIVTGYDSSLVGPLRWTVGSTDYTILNRCEWTPASYPFTHGNGVTVVNSSGFVATVFGGSTASTCKIRAIGVGSVVDVSVNLDTDNSAVYSYYEPNSAQP